MILFINIWYIYIIINILVTSNTIKLAPFDWALNLVLFQICVRDSYLLRGIQNVNFNVWVVPICDRDRNAVKYTKKSAHDRWASSDQGHCDHELFFRITFICTDVTAKCIYNIWTGFYIVGLHWLRQNPLFVFQLNDFIEIWESSTENEICFWLSIFQLVL